MNKKPYRTAWICDIHNTSGKGYFDCPICKNNTKRIFLEEHECDKNGNPIHHFYYSLN